VAGPIIAPPPTGPAQGAPVQTGAVPVLTPDGKVTTVPAGQLGPLLAQGYKPNPTAQDVALAEAAQHPIEAAGEAALGAAIPGGRHLLTDTKEHQALLSEANPTASTLGSVGGGLAQALAVGAATGGLGDLAEGAEAVGEGAEAASALPSLGGAAKAFGTNALQGVTQGMSEQDLGDTGYNASALALDGGLAGIMGLGVESAFSAGKALVPKAIEAARGSLTKLDGLVGDVLGRASAAVTGEESLVSDIPAAIAERRATGPLSKFAKKAAAAEQRDSAVDLAGALNDTMDSVADVADYHFGTSRPAEVAIDAAGHDAAGGVGAAKQGAKDLLGKVRAGLDEVKARIAPALGAVLEDGTIDPMFKAWPKPIVAVENYVRQFKNAVEDPTLFSSSNVHDAAREMRQLSQRALKFGNKIEGTDADAINGLQHQVIAPMQDFLGRYAEGGKLTPESLNSFGTAAADRNAVVNKAWSQLTEAQKNLEPLLGVKTLENGRPETNIDPAKIERLIRGEGAPGEVPTKLSALRAKTALDNYMATARHYVNVAEESATRANVETGTAAKARGMLQEVIEKREAAQEQLSGALGPKMQRVADLTSLTGQGAGGLRGALANAGATGAELAAGALGLGHPVVGAAVGAIGLAKRAFVAAKYPVETINTYINITQSAAKVAGMVSSGIRKILAAPATEVAKRAGTAVLIAGIGSQEELDAARKQLAKDSKLLTAYGENPSAMAHAFATNTAGLAEHAPQHAAAVASVAVRANQVLSAALPRNPAPPSPLGPAHDSWAPSDSQVLAYAQIRRAVLSPPSTVLGDWRDGTQSVAAYKAFCQVHPEIDTFIAHKALLEAVKDQTRVLDIGQKFVLSQLCHMPVTPELSVASIAAQQAVFAANPSPQSGGAPKGTRGAPRSAGLDKMHVAEDTAFHGSAPGAEGAT
jgi:hypothetical protein